MGYFFLFVFIVGVVIVFRFFFKPYNTDTTYEGLDTLIMEVRCKYGKEDFLKGQNMTAYQRKEKEMEVL